MRTKLSRAYVCLLIAGCAVGCLQLPGEVLNEDDTDQPTVPGDGDAATVDPFVPSETSGGELTVPDGFKIVKLADLDLPIGVTSTHRTGVGHFGQGLYVVEHSENQVVRVDKEGDDAITFTRTSILGPSATTFTNGRFGQRLFVGSQNGIAEIRTDGRVEPFALLGNPVIGLDFGRGRYDGMLYAAVSAGAGQVAAEQPGLFKVDADASLESLVSGSFLAVAFSRGARFGNSLYVTPFDGSARIFTIDPDGTKEVFAELDSDYGPLLGLGFGRGQAFGHFMYLGFGDGIIRVAPDKSSEVWAVGAQVRGIHFEPVGRGAPGVAGGLGMFVTLESAVCAILADGVSIEKESRP